MAKTGRPNLGKKFEQAFRKSIPDYVLTYRPPDAAQSFDMRTTSTLRFSKQSPCDFILFDGYRNTLWTLELKTFDGACSFERDEFDRGTIHYYQILSLQQMSRYKNVRSGLVLDFRRSNNTYFLDIGEWDKLINSIKKKSFNEDDLLKYCNPYLFDKVLLKVNYRYDVENFLEDTRIG